MSPTTMTSTPSDIALPLCDNTPFKDEMVQRISAHIVDEVRDYINTYDICLEGDAYKDELEAILSYLDSNLTIYIK
jgi:hypothetical protein